MTPASDSSRMSCDSRSLSAARRRKLSSVRLSRSLRPTPGIGTSSQVLPYFCSRKRLNAAPRSICLVLPLR